MCDCKKVAPVASTKPIYSVVYTNVHGVGTSIATKATLEEAEKIQANTALRKDLGDGLQVHLLKTVSVVGVPMTPIQKIQVCE